MKKQFGGLLCGCLLFLGSSALAADNLTSEYMAEYNYPIGATYEETKEAYAGNLTQAAVDRAHYEMFQERLKKMSKDSKLKQDKQQELTSKLERRKMMLDTWELKQQELLDRLTELRSEIRLKRGQTSDLKATPEQLAVLEKKLDKKTKQLEKELKKLYKTASRDGDYVEAINLVNGRVEKKKLELIDIANQYVDVYTLLRQHNNRPSWTTGVDMQTLEMAGYLPLEGKQPKNMSRVEAAERVASLLKALENGLYPDISEDNLKAAARLRAEFAKELVMMEYFDDEEAQLSAETQAAWESAVKKKHRLQISDELRLDAKKDSGDVSNRSHIRLRNRLYADYHLAGTWHAVGMVESTKFLKGEGKNSLADLERYYVTGNIGIATITTGVFGANIAEGNIYDSKFKGVMVEAGSPVHYTMRYGSNNAAHNTYTFTAEYSEAGKYSIDGGYNHFGMDDSLGGGSRNIWYGNVHIPLRKFDLGLMYLHGSDSHLSRGGNNGFVGTLSWGRERSWEAGNTSVYAKYYYQPRSTYVQHTMNGTADSMDGFKGWGFGLTHTIAENVMATLEFDHLKEIVGNRQNNTIWAAISYFFGN